MHIELLVKTLLCTDVDFVSFVSLEILVSLISELVQVLLYYSYDLVIHSDDNPDVELWESFLI